MEPILVTIIIPVYNCQKYIRECVESIEKSSFKNYEIILVNDGSKDDSGNICKELLEKYKNIVYLSQENSGVSVARNNGIEHSKGDFLIFIDGDDKITPALISELYNNIKENDDIDIVCCNYSCFDDNTQYNEYFFNKNFIAGNNEEKSDFFMQLLDESYGRGNNNFSTAVGVPWGKIYRKSAIKEIRFDPDLRRMQDNVFNMFAFAAARKIKFINQNLYLYRIEHVENYIKGKILVTPENLNKISILRHSFFKENPQFENDAIRLSVYMDDLSFIGTCFQYYIKQSKSKTEAIKNIKIVCETSCMGNEICSSNIQLKSIKRKVLKFMCKHKMYGSIYIFYKLIINKS